MNRIYMDAKDKNVAAVIVYANSSNKLFYTSTLTGDKAVAVPDEDQKDLFFKGVFAVKGGVTYAAKSLSAAGVIDFGFSA